MMKTNIYFSHGFACDLTATDLIRRILKHLGYNVIEHEGTWTDASLQKFLDCEYKLFFTPDFSENVGRGQAEMMESALARHQKVYVVDGFLDLENAKDKEPYILVEEVESLDLIRNNYKTDWAMCNFFSDDVGLSEGSELKIQNVCPLKLNTICLNSNLMLGAAKAYLDKK